MNRRAKSKTFENLLQQREQVEILTARLLGQRWRVYVLARSFTQFSNWCTDNPASRRNTFVSHPDQLAGLRLIPGVVELVKLDGWEEQASAEMLNQVRRLEARSS